MKIKLQYILLLFGTAQLFAQKKDENIGTEVVNVVKPYTPTISDAFKVKETPIAEDEDNSKKVPINYSIFSFPVASTFAPAKGKAANVDKTKEERLYQNYLSAGLGNYFTIFADLYVTENVSDTDYIAGVFNYFGSQSNIKEARIDSNFFNTAIDLTYGSKQKEYSWNTDLGYQIQKYHWYGLPEDFGLNATPQLVLADIKNSTNTQTYNSLNFGGQVTFRESVVDGISLKYNRFWDAYQSSENRLVINPNIGFEAFNKNIKTEFLIDHVGGEFKNDFSNSIGLKYGITNLGVHPSFGMNEDAWSFTIGASIFYSLDHENSKNKLFFYPNALASLKVVGDYMVFYTGVSGGLEQNSYRDFVGENPFVSPTLIIAPTDRQFEAFAGLKGKLSNYTSYNVKGSIGYDKNRAFFKATDYSDVVSNQKPYQYGNSFDIIYDSMRYFQLFGELKADFTQDISFSINGSLMQNDPSNQKEAWNLPSFQMATNLEVAITSKWYAGANLFFVGERKDQQTRFGMTGLVADDSVKTIESYFDANVHLGYKYNDRLTGFLRFNNIANQAYQRWLNFPVQSFQVMLGANYKFDF